MAVEDKVRARLSDLISQSKSVSRGNQYDQCVDSRQQAACSAWIAGAQNAIHLVIASPTAPYRLKADRIAAVDHGLGVHKVVGELSSVLDHLIVDAEAGLLAFVANQARAEIFDDFLDHAQAYVRDTKKKGIRGDCRGCV